MIKNWLLTGDCHRIFSRFRRLDKKYQNEETAVIILGDAGFNVTLDQDDADTKRAYCKHNQFYTYCVRGNHEARPQDCPNIKTMWDDNVDGRIYYDIDFPRIRYFFDYGIYTINGYRTLVMGGAYSVDKHYRLARGLHWFQNEQLTTQEQLMCRQLAHGQHFDLVLTHTCPYDWRPTDLFLRGLDQSTVDNTMERFFESFKDSITFDVWCFGHYHADRIERPGVEMFYTEIENLEEIMTRWDKYQESGHLDWWLSKGPNFYIGE